MIIELIGRLLPNIIFLLTPNYGFSLNPLTGPYILMFETRSMGEDVRKTIRSHSNISAANSIRKAEERKRKEKEKASTLLQDNYFSISPDKVDDFLKEWITDMLESNYDGKKVKWLKKNFGTFNLDQVKIVSNDSAFLLTIGDNSDKKKNLSHYSWYLIHLKSSKKGLVYVYNFKELFISPCSSDDLCIVDIRKVKTLIPNAISYSYMVTIGRNELSKVIKIDIMEKNAYYM